MTRPPQAALAELADRLHSSAIHLLRRLRVQDSAAGLSAPRLSALSVIVYAGPIRMSDLATAEQVRLPTISRLVRELERDHYVERVADPAPMGACSACGPPVRDAACSRPAARAVYRSWRRLWPRSAAPSNARWPAPPVCSSNWRDLHRRPRPRVKDAKPERASGGGRRPGTLE